MSEEEKSALAKIIEGGVEDAIGASLARAIESGGDPESIMGAAAVGLLRGSAKKGAMALARFLSKSKADCGLAEAVSREMEEHLELVAPIVEENAERLLEDPDVRREDLASNTAAILVGWEKAYRATGDAKKRRIIMAALGNAFRPELFKEGLTLRLFRILEELDYGEVRYLRDAFGAGGKLRSEMVGPHGVLISPVAAGREHLERLSELRLVHWSHPTSHEMRNIAQEATRTWLGEQLLALCADTEALNRIWPDPDVKPAQ